MKIIFLFFFSCLAINAAEFSLQCGFIDNGTTKIGCKIIKKLDNEKVAYALITNFLYDIPTIATIEVSDDFRRQGFSSVLIYQIIVYAKEKWNIPNLYLFDSSTISKEIGRSYYIRYGFTCKKYSNNSYECNGNAEDITEKPENIARYEAGIANIDIEPFSTIKKRSL